MKKAKRIKWIADSFSILVLITLVAGIYFSVGYVNPSSQEPRSKLIIALNNGALFWATLTFIFTLASIALFVTKRYIKLLIALVILLGSGLMLYVSVSNLRPFYQDAVIYQSKHNPQEWLIIQYYETGIGGNPQKRIIQTSNMEADIRDIETIPTPARFDTLYAYREIQTNSLEQFVHRKDTFMLREIKDISHQ
jgi:hypothetical protein